MAPQRAHLSGLIAGAAILAAIIAGCGGDSPSAPGTAAGTSASTASSTTAAEAGGGSAGTDAAKPKPKKEGGQVKDPAAASGEKEHPPIELPTGAPERGPTEAQQAKVPTANIAVSMPTGLAAVNTCKGKNASPELRWTGVPSDTAELAVFAVNLQPVDGKLHFVWAMAGIDPSLEGLEEGEVPKGAILGRSSDGQNKYSLCPQSSDPEIYLFSVFAITKDLAPKQGFDPLAFRKEATRASEENGIVTATYGAG